MPFDSTEHTQDKKSEWTLAIDLDLNFPAKDSKGRHLGAEQKQAMLKELAVETVGKPVTIVAQAITASKKHGKNVDRPAQMQRFAIHDGAIEEISTTKAGTFDSDLQGLMQIAQERYPSKKIGLVVSAHGGGGGGMSGTDGSIEIPDLKQTIAKSLSGRGHEKLDVLDFDSCLMAQTAVLGQMSPVADDVVASPGVEYDDTQNLNAWIKDLLARPQLDGRQLGNAIVSEASAGSNSFDSVLKGRSLESNTPTLTNFYLKENYAAFSASLDELGTALKDFVATKKNRQLVESVLTFSQPYYSDAEGGDAPLTVLDLKAFVNSLQKFIGSRFIPDPDHKLSSACQHVLETENKMIPSRYASIRPASWGGLSAYVPRADAWHSDAYAKRNTAVGQIFEDCSGGRLIGRERVGDDMAGALSIARKQAVGYPQTLALLNSLVSPIKRLQNPDSLSYDQFTRIDANICKTAAVALDQEPFSLIRGLYKQALDDDIAAQIQADSNHGGWSQFVNEWAKNRQ